MTPIGVVTGQPLSIATFSSRNSPYLLVNVQLPEDLCCVEKMLILEDPAVMISVLPTPFASILISLTSWHYKPVMEG